MRCVVLLTACLVLPCMWTWWMTNMNWPRWGETLSFIAAGLYTVTVSERHNERHESSQASRQHDLVSPPVPGQGPARLSCNNSSEGNWQPAPPAPPYQVKEKHTISGVNTLNDVRIGDESSSSSSTITHNLQLLTSHKNDDWNNSNMIYCCWYKLGHFCLLKFLSAEEPCIDWQIF